MKWIIKTCVKKHLRKGRHLCLKQTWRAVRHGCGFQLCGLLTQVPCLCSAAGLAEAWHYFLAGSFFKVGRKCFFAFLHLLFQLSSSKGTSAHGANSPTEPYKETLLPTATGLPPQPL